MSFPWHVEQLVLLHFDIILVTVISFLFSHFRVFFSSRFEWLLCRNAFCHEKTLSSSLPDFLLFQETWGRSKHLPFITPTKASRCWFYICAWQTPEHNNPGEVAQSYKCAPVLDQYWTLTYWICSTDVYFKYIPYSLLIVKRALNLECHKCYFRFLLVIIH